ncbi:MAG: hypothetical protein SOW59_08130 [Corynebacterium sp.]|nr:hypothetical protein [Corynebacterium sp.]
MTSIPPLKPQTSAQNTSGHNAAGAPEPGDHKRPEVVSLLVTLMMAVVACELIHQIVSAVITVVNIDIVQAMARKNFEQDSALPEAFTRASAWFAFGFSTILSLVIIGVLAWAVRTFADKGKYVAGARRIMFIFSLYFAFRILMVFLSKPIAASAAPDWLFALDGVVQILAGVGGILCVIFASRTETLDYTGELEKIRELEKEQKKLMEERAREKREAQAEKKKSSSSSAMSDDDFGTLSGMLKRWRSGGKKHAENDKQDRRGNRDKTDKK